MPPHPTQGRLSCHGLLPPKNDRSDSCPAPNAPCCHHHPACLYHLLEIINRRDGPRASLGHDGLGTSDPPTLHLSQHRVHTHTLSQVPTGHGSVFPHTTARGWEELAGTRAAAACSEWGERGIHAQRKGPHAATSNARWSVQNWLLRRSNPLSTSSTLVSSPFTAAGGVEARKGSGLAESVQPLTARLEESREEPLKRYLRKPLNNSWKALGSVWAPQHLSRGRTGLSDLSLAGGDAALLPSAEQPCACTCSGLHFRGNPHGGSEAQKKETESAVTVLAVSLLAGHGGLSSTGLETEKAGAHVPGVPVAKSLHRGLLVRSPLPLLQPLPLESPADALPAQSLGASKPSSVLAMLSLFPPVLLLLCPYAGLSSCRPIPPWPPLWARVWGWRRPPRPQDGVLAPHPRCLSENCAGLFSATSQH